MKQLISLVLILGTLFSCVKETDYPIVFQYNYNSVTTPNITDYTAIISDTSLLITGNHADGTIHINIPKIGGNPLVVGEYSVAAENGFYIAYTNTAGVTTKAAVGSLNLTHINSYVNFTFEGSLYNSSIIENGIAKNLPVVTEELFYDMTDSSNAPIVPFFPLDTVTNGIYAEIPGTTSPFYVPSTNISKTVNTSNQIYTATSGGFMVEITLEKPLNNLLGVNYDLTQANQTAVKMKWYDLNQPFPNNTLEFKEGVFQLYSIDHVDGELEFGFSGKLYNTTQTIDQPLPVGCGKKIDL